MSEKKLFLTSHQQPTRSPLPKTAASNWRHALSATVRSVTGYIVAMLLTIAYFVYVQPHAGPATVLIVAYVMAFTLGLLIFRAPFVASRLGVGYWLAVRRALLSEFTSVNLGFAGMVPTLFLLKMCWLPEAFDLGNPLGWLIISLAALAGALVLYPFNAWMAHRGFVRRSGQADAREDAALRTSSRSAWGALLLSFGVLAAAIWLVSLILSTATAAASVPSSGQRFPDAIPPAPADLESLTLVPYINGYQGFHSVVPEGWFEAMSDVAIFVSGPPETRPGATLILRMEGGSTLNSTIGYWLPLLGLQELPEQTDLRRTPSLTWDLYAYETNDPDMGPRKGAMALAETDDGVYMVVLVAMLNQYEVLYETVFLSAVDALAPASDLPSRYQEYANWPVTAAIEGVGNSAHKSVEFVLDRCTHLRVYAIGEGNEQGMADYGLVENVATGQVVWRMYHFETESAGHPRNRRVDRSLSLPAGTYRLHFETNGTHAFADWGDRPPGHRFWGITLFEDQSPETSQATCWERSSRPEGLGWSSVKLKGLIPELERRDVAALMVVTNGQVVFEWGNTANNFRSHSMRKSLLSALYGVYVAEGEIESSRTLQDLGIDDLKPLTESEKQATVTDLLSARSGVYIPAAAEAQSMRDERPERESHKPGTHWYYNNWDFNALGTIFCRETDEDLYQAFETRIAGPLGMQDFCLEDQRYSYEYWLSMHPAYPFRISARDLARFGQLYLQRGDWQGQQILPARWIEESTRSHSTTGKAGTYSGYGYMWWVAAKDYGEIAKGSYAASGYGGHTLEVLSHLNTVIALRVNTDDPSSRWIGSDEVDDLILTILAAGEGGQ